MSIDAQNIYDSLGDFQYFYDGEFSASKRKRIFPMTTKISEEVFDGEVARIAFQARDILQGSSDSDVEYVLKVTDTLFLSCVMDSRITIQDPTTGETHKLELELLPKLSPADMIVTVAILFLDGATLVIEPDLQIGPEEIEIHLQTSKIFAAFALKECFLAVQYDHIDWTSTSGVFHAINAARAISQAQLLQAGGNAEEIIRKFYGKDVITTSTSKAANARWGKLDPVKELAFQKRREYGPKISRAAAIRLMKNDVLVAARGVGIPLIGLDPETTIDSWFRRAQID